MDEVALRAEAQQVLRRLGPTPVPQIANELDTTLSSRELWELLLEDDHDDFVAFPLGDGRLCDLDALLDDLTLTHHLSEEERATGRVLESPDFSPLLLVTALEDPPTLLLADGGELRLESPYLTGPQGWLPEQPVLLLRLVDGRVEVSGLDQAPEHDHTTVARLVETFERHRERPYPLDPPELLVETRAIYPRLLAEPQAPLGELLAEAGLEVVDHAVRFADDHPEDRDDLDLDDLDLDDLDLDGFDELDEFAEHLVEDHGLDEEDLDDALTLNLTLDLMEGRLAVAMEGWLAEMDEGGMPDLSQLPAALGLDKPLEDRGDEDLTEEQVEEQAWTRTLANGIFALLAMLRDQDLAFIVDEDLISRSPLRALIVDVLLDLLSPQLRTSEERANAAWLRARIVETTGGDHADADALMRQAVEHDPRHIEATLAAAEYLDVRGQAGAALAHLNRIEGPDLDAWRELLVHYAQRGPASAGRNEPCPCGSGRKYKACCQRSNGWPLAERIDWMWQKVSRFLGSPAITSIMYDVAENLIHVIDPTEALSEHQFVVNNLVLFESGGLERMCELRGALLPADELDLLRAWSQVRATLCEVVEVVPGAGLTVLDLASGERTRLHDISLSRQLEVGRAILLWIVPTPTGPAPSGGGVNVPDHRRVEVLDLLAEHPDGPTLASWYASLSAPPQVRTTEGDPLLFTTMTYRVADPPAAWRTLSEHLEEDGEDRLVAIADPDGDRWLRGSISREGDVLTVETNSAPRAAWFADLLAEVVPDAELIDEQRRPFVPELGDLLEDDDALDDGDGPPAGALDLDDLDPEERAALEEHLDGIMARHEEAWVDTELPALGGATPRQAAEDPTRRGTLLRLLDEMEERARSWEGPGRGMDVAGLRRRLSL